MTWVRWFDEIGLTDVALLKTTVAIVEAEEAIAERRPETRRGLTGPLEATSSTKQPVVTGADQ